MKKNITFLMVVLFLGITAKAQNVVYGKVLVGGKYPLGNVVVMAKKSKAKVTTNIYGQYAITCKKKDVLTFNAYPFYTVKEKIKDTDSLDVNLVFKNKEIDKDKMVELGLIQPSDIDAVVKMVQDPAYEFMGYTNIYDVIQKKYPMVNVSGNKIVVRQKTSFKGGNFALLLVNGVEVNDISYINPLELKSIKLLFGQETVIYGSRGSSGVLVIETK